MSNPLLEKFSRNEPCRGAWLGLPTPFSARLLARLPLDWLMIDAEHAPVDASSLALMVAAIAEARGPAPLVRIAQSSVENIKRALDSGAAGVLVPMVNTRAEAEQAVSWAKFPPQGTRSFGSSYAGLAFGQSMPEYLKAANRQTLLAVQIESQAALENLDEIFTVDGIDMAFVGPVDLSVSLGLDPLPENPHPAFQEALGRIVEAAHRHHMPLGIYCSGGAAAGERIRQGFLFVNVISDINALLGGVRAALEASQ
jgi:4-hydroxy-2-oxoheptanedioate aldolase